MDQVVTDGDNCNYSYDFTLTLGTDLSVGDLRIHDKPFESRGGGTARLGEA